jgi:hypothetical protein
VKKFAVLLLFIVAVVGCSKTNPLAPSAPSTPDLAGSWSGSITDNVAGRGTFHATINQTMYQVNGTWSTSYGKASDNRSGNLSGFLAGGVVMLSLATPNYECAYQFNPSTIQNKHLAGGYLITGTCNGSSQAGQLDISR